MIFLTYLLKSGACAAILWMAYQALFRKGTHFTFNRFYLLSVIPLSSVIPLLRLPLLPPAESPALITIEGISSEPLAETATQGFPAVTLLLVLYFAGAGVVAFRFIKHLCRMHRAMTASRFSDAENYAAFTFFRKIYINRRTLSDGDYEKILWHEQVHARQLHSIDLVVAQLFVTMQWFNPFAWRLKKSIVATHEYLADAQVLAQGVDVNIYQQLLFFQTTGVYPEYASGFSYSLTKKRLIMMTKNKTGKFFALKLCGLLPALALPVALFGLSTAETASPVTPTNDSTYFVVETVKIEKAHFQEESDSIYLAIQAQYRDIQVQHQDIQHLATQAQQLGIQAQHLAIQVQHQDIQHLVTQAQQLGIQAQHLAIQVQQLQDTATTKRVRFTPPKTSEGEKVYIAGAIDVNPEFPGGQGEMMKFIYANLKYPKEAAGKKIQGRVALRFIVKADGNISEVTVQKGVDPLLDAEAARVVKAMPAWTPGKHEGKAVAVQFVLPVVFRLAKEKAPETE